MSSSKRGRKRNDNLPPNRARDVQRAFRARRTAHLQALEQRVTELEEENDYLRQGLNLPPANRPPLGRGPTGKDKPIPPKPCSTGSPFSSSRESESSLAGDSPPSRQSSRSPLPENLMPVSMSPTRPMTVIDDGASVWDEQPMLLSSSSQPSTSHSHSILPHDVTYSMPVPGSMVMKPLSYAPYPLPVPSPSRQRDTPGSDGPSRTHPREQERPPPNTFTQQSYPVAGDLHGDMERSQHYMPYRQPHSNSLHSPQSPLSSTHYTERQLHHPQPISNHPPSFHHHEPHTRELESPIPFDTRIRQLNTAYPLGQTYPHLPHPETIGFPARSQHPEYLLRPLELMPSLSDNTRSPYSPENRSHGPM